MSNLSQKFSCFICLSFLSNIVSVRGLKDEEPFCTSKFDYDYKMLQKMVMLEMEYNKLTAQMKEHFTVIENLEARLRDESEKLLKMATTLQRVEDAFSLGQLGATYATYVRWGRTSCPGNGTELVYKGYAAGSHFNKRGAAANNLCLPEEPLWNVYEDGEQVANGVYGVEYEFHHRKTERFFADGRLFYMTEAKCGALRCPPYIQGRELTCSVCSK